MPLFGTDGGTNNPDTLTLFKSEIEYPEPLGKVTYKSGNTLYLNKKLREGTLEIDDIIILIQGNLALLMQSNSNSGTGSLESIEVNTASGRFHRPGADHPTFNVVDAYVYNLRDASLVTYYVDTDKNQLMAAYHDQKVTAFDDSTSRSVVVAYNIEDLQLFYYFNDENIDLSKVTLDPLIGYNEFKNKRVRAVAIAMTSRAEFGLGPARYYRPALFNHVQGATLDNRRRSSTMELISLRNSLQ
jgi:hypothetical protein